MLAATEDKNIRLQQKSIVLSCRNGEYLGQESQYSLRQVHEETNEMQQCRFFLAYRPVMVRICLGKCRYRASIGLAKMSSYYGWFHVGPYSFYSACRESTASTRALAGRRCTTMVPFVSDILTGEYSASFYS